MKVHIGPFKNWIGPYQIADLLKYVGVSEDKCHSIGERLSETFLSKLCNWIDSKRKRKVKVRIDNYDVWNMDSTLAYIILPMLKKLKECQHGAPFTDDDDAPEHLRSYNAPKKENEWDTDDFHFPRWEWILDEIIWTFEQIHPDYDWESQYHTGVADIQWKDCNDGTGNSEMIRGPKDTHVFDKEGYTKHQERISNGLRLFGRYYQGLWD